MPKYVVDAYKKRIYESGLKVAKIFVDDYNDGKSYLRGNLDLAKQAMLDELEKIKLEEIFQSLPPYSQISIINSISCSDLQIYWRTKVKRSHKIILISVTLLIILLLFAFILQMI
jgi:hypothetical protein